LYKNLTYKSSKDIYSNINLYTNIQMKKLKLIITLFVLIITINVNAQAKPEKKAKKIATEMSKVLSLDKKESKAVYKIQLNRFNESKSIVKEYTNQPEIKKQKLNKLGSKVYNQLKDLLGMERLKIWKSYKKNK
jgi:type III secretory pathway component EscR